MTGERESGPGAAPVAQPGTADGRARRRGPTPADDLTRQARLTPGAPALAWDGGAWSFRELDDRAAALAERFSSMGAAPGEAVTLCATPGPEAVAALFGLWRAGCVAVPLHDRLTPAEVERSRKTVVSSLHIDNSALQLSRPGHPPPDQTRPGQTRPDHPRRGHPLPGHPPPGRAHDAEGRYAGFPDVTTFVLTSGSSGAPRAVGFTRRAFAESASAVADRLGLTDADRWGLCLSPGHIGGLSLLVRAVMTGSSVRLWPSFDAGAVAGAVLAGEVTHLAVVPVMLRRLLTRLGARRIPPTLRCVLVGGAAAPRALLDDAWTAGLPLATTWGMTETASQIATAPPGLARRHPGTAGRPLRGVEVRTAGDAMAESASAPRQPPLATPSSPARTLQVRGPTLAAILIRGPGAAPEPLSADAEGWFATRDLGRVDSDGLVWIEGRADAMIVSGALNVSPAEVERVIERLPGVREAVVFGVPDAEWGEVVAAVVEGDPPVVSAEEVDRHCRGRLARGRCPSRIRVVEALPRTRTGKVMRPAAAALLGHEASGPPAQERPDAGSRAGRRPRPASGTQLREIQ